MTTQELVVDKTRCSGCTACVHVCRHNAIHMLPDSEWFLYPVIDRDKCVNCRLCVEVCKNLDCTHSLTNNAYAAVALDTAVRLESSSGGIFSLLAGNTLQENGVVFGAAFDDKFRVRHIAIEGEDCVAELRGSKYVQSSLLNSFFLAKQFLDSGRKVLFSGTPCQIAGLKGYLHKEYDNLTAVDFICHGVPSPKVWGRYVEAMQQRARAQIRRISFRAKDSSWKRYAVSFVYTNDTAYLRYHGDDLFMRGFLVDLYLRPSCYACRFKGNNRASDVTLADFWGVEHVMPDMDDDLGTSMVIVNTRQGEAVFDSVKQKMRYKETSIEQIKQYNPALICSAKRHPHRDKFFADMENENNDFMKILDAYTRETYQQKVKRRIKKYLKFILEKLHLLETVKKFLAAHEKCEQSGNSRHK